MTFRDKIWTILMILGMVLLQLLVIVLATAERGYMAVGGECGVLLFVVGLKVLKECLDED